MTEPRVLTEIDGQIAYVWLNRPDKLNGVDLELIEELIAAAESLKSNRDVRAVVLQGKGRSFCAGLDFGAAFKDKKKVARFFLAGPRAVNKFQKVTTIWRDLPVPVIAVVHGHCYGAGVQLAAGADFRFTTPDATWSILEAKWGLVPDMGGTVPFGDQMKADDVMRLSMTGEQITGARAAEVGLATEAVDEPIKAALGPDREDRRALAGLGRSHQEAPVRQPSRQPSRGMEARAQAASRDVQVGQHQDRPRGRDGQAASVVPATHLRLVLVAAR